MDIRKLQRAIVDGLEDVKAQNIRVFNTEHLSPLFERVIVATGASNRQTKALAASVRDSVKSRGLQVLRTDDGAIGVVSVARYLDTLKRTAAGWRLAHRTVVIG